MKLHQLITPIYYRWSVAVSGYFKIGKYVLDIHLYLKRKALVLNNIISFFKNWIDIHMTGRILALIINFKIAIQKFMHNKTSIYQPLFTMWPFNTACHVNWMRIATLYVLINFHWYSRIAIDVLWWNLKNVGWVQTTFDIGLKYHFNK